MSQTLDTSITMGITLTADGTYISPFTITAAGTVNTAGQYGVYAAFGNAVIFNNGVVSAAATGIALDFTSGGDITNNGLISGGNGANAPMAAYGTDGAEGSHGGTAAALAGPGVLINTGTIYGGVGGNGGWGYQNGFPIYSSSNGGIGGLGGTGVRLSDSAALENAGVITGGTGGHGGQGGRIAPGYAGNGGAGNEAGVGVAVMGAGYVYNTGTISGGAGGFGGNGGERLLVSGYATGGAGGAGNAGISFSNAGSLNNRGDITGGAGGYGGGVPYTGPGAGNGGSAAGGNGGAGVILAGAGSVGNTGTIAGGAGGNGGFGYNGASGGTGGAGLILQGADSLSNNGVIAGGAGGLSSRINGYNNFGVGGAGGTGLSMTGTGVVTNNKSISGGAGGAGGASTNNGRGAQGGGGGTGAALAGAETLVNEGAITGGAGGNAGASSPNPVTGDEAGNGGNGGDGLNLATLVIAANTGTISGGAGGQGANAVYFPALGTAYNSGGQGGTGGAGADISGTLTNSGAIQGGAAGAEGNNVSRGRPLAGATGGTGVNVESGGVLLNSGQLIGGTGGAGSSSGSFGIGFYAPGSAAGAGGAGAYVNGGYLANTGTISGGAGGTGGIGVKLNGGVFVDAGTVTGAAGADAVLFGAAAGTLIVAAGAVFNGNVVANAGVADTLEIAASGTFAGIGTKFQNFKNISLVSGSAVTLVGNIAGLASGELISGLVYGDEVILDGFSATTETFTNTGIVLGNGTSFETLSFSNALYNLSPNDYLLSTAGGNTTIAARRIIHFTTGISSVIEGGTASLAAGAAIQNFALGDGLVLDGFSATSATFVPGTGLLLSNGTTTQTLDIAGNFDTNAFYVTAASGNTTVQLRIDSLASTITQTVTLGNGTYAPEITLTSGGMLQPGDANGIYAASSIVGAMITNDGVINAGQDGILLAGSGTIINGGTISGAAAAIDFSGTGANRLIVYPNAVFTGTVMAAGAGASNTLEFAAGAGTLVGIGSQFEDFNTILFDRNADWRIEGNATGLATGETINGFTTGSTIILDSFAATSETYVAGTGLELSNGTITETLDITGNFSSAGFAFTSSGGSTTVHSLIETVSTNIAQTVDLGDNTYAAIVTIATTGTVQNLAPNANGIYAAAGSGFTRLVNFGAIRGANDGVLLEGSSTLDNKGIIAGGANALVFAGGGNNRLIVEHGAVFTGTVSANAAASNTLELGTGSGALTGLGSQFTGFQTIDFDSGASWNLEGNAAGLTALQTISGFGGSDAIILDGFAATSGTFVAGSGLQLSNGSTTEILHLSQLPGNETFYLRTSGGNTTIQEAVGFITSAQTTGVVLGNGTYGNVISISSTGHIYSTTVAGLYSADNAVYAATTVGTVSNAGTLSGAYFGILLRAGGLVSNTGLITGGRDAVVFYGNASTTINDGTIATTGYGIRVGSGAGTIINNGTIEAGSGVELIAGGYVANGKNDVIAGTGYGIRGYSPTGFGQTTTIINAGTIRSAYFNAVVLDNDSTIENTGIISGYFQGVFLSNGGTIVNSGTIAGRYAAVHFQGGYNNRLVDDPGAVFIGNVFADATGFTDTLELASGSSSGTITGIGSSFTGFTTIAIDAGAHWILAGGNALTGELTIAAGATLADTGALTSQYYVTNNGLITTDPSTAIFGGAVAGTGTIEIGAGSDVTFNASVSSGQKIIFDDATGTLTLGDPSQFSATVYELQPGDTIDFSGIGSAKVASATLGAGNELVLRNAAGGVLAEIRLDPAQNFAHEGFAATSDGAGGTDVTAEVLCFLAGTNIATPDGEVAVETLRIGQPVLTADGAAVPVRWIGIRAVATRFADPARVMPIRIRAGALGEGVPHRDLLVSPCHAIYLGGILIQAGALVNGISILREHRMPERFTYYHVETAGHALILAEGAAAESFVDNVDRLGFDNWAEHVTLYGNEATIAEMPYPRAKAARQVPRALREMLAGRARHFTLQRSA